MSEKNPFEGQDKIAALALGVPALAGAMILSLALFSPGSAPNRDRGRMIPISAGLLLLGVGGGSAYVYRRIGKARALHLEERARTGALQLLTRQRSPGLIDISCALADEFVLMPGECAVPPTQNAGPTAGQLSKAVHSTIRK